jgi:hypothetical protein
MPPLGPPRHPGHAALVVEFRLELVVKRSAARCPAGRWSNPCAVSDPAKSSLPCLRVYNRHPEESAHPLWDQTIQSRHHTDHSRAHRSNAIRPKMKAPSHFHFSRWLCGLFLLTASLWAGSVRGAGEIGDGAGAPGLMWQAGGAAAWTQTRRHRSPPGGGRAGGGGLPTRRQSRSGISGPPVCWKR